jgi:prephenate dehydratase
VRIAYLGPAGTFTEDALREALEPGVECEPLRTATIREAILAVERGEAERALVPFENSIEGSVRTSLDTLAFDAADVTIVGEHDFAVHPHLIAEQEIELGEIEVVLSHPQPLAQCARFLREKLPQAKPVQASSTAEAVRLVCESPESYQSYAAIGARSAAEIYGGRILVEGIEDEANNVTRFVWIAPSGTEPSGGQAWKTSLVFAELGEDHPGALVEALREFSSRAVNLSRIESRPLRRELGRYMFFCDLEGALSEPAVAAAVEALRGKAESVRILGSYPTR